MDHEIRDHVDVRRPFDKFPQALGLNEARAVDLLRQGHDAGVETFQMTDLENGPRLVGQGDDPLALPARRGDGFLQQQMDATAQQKLGHGQVGRGGYDNGDGIDLIDDGRQIGESRATRLAGHGAGSGRIGIDHPHELDLGQARIDEGMKAAQIADPNNGNPESFNHDVILARDQKRP